MPFCRVADYTEEDVAVASNGVPSGVEIFYQLYGHGDTKVLLITGVAATHQAWGPQLVDLCGTDVPNGLKGKPLGHGCTIAQNNVGQNNNTCNGRDERNGYGEEPIKGGNGGNGVQVCAFDNRGVGKSSAPHGKHHYTTTIMAMDALTVMDYLGWERAHVAGHSMGGMIAFKLAAIAPDRVASLALISTTGGGYECLPKINKTMIKIAYRFMRAKTPEERAHVDLDTHYTQDYLDTIDGKEYRRAVLFKEYVKNLSNGMQTKHGLDGQFNACWTHQIAPRELDRIRSAGIGVAVIHGRGDIVAQVQHARNLAKKLCPVARMVELPGGHMVTHQNTKEVNEAMLDVIRMKNYQVHLSESSDESCLHGKRWQIWQRVEVEDSRAIISKQVDFGCVGVVVDLLYRMWPQWLSMVGLTLVQDYSRLSLHESLVAVITVMAAALDRSFNLRSEPRVQNCEIYGPPTNLTTRLTQTLRMTCYCFACQQFTDDSSLSLILPTLQHITLGNKPA